jgi:hypothetical protein
MKQIALILLICTSINMISLGQYKNVSWDLFQYSGLGLKQIGWLATKHSGEIQSSPWSVGCETLDRDYAKFSIYKDFVGELGVKHARLQSGWAKCETERGKYNFAWLDSCVNGLAEQSYSRGCACVTAIRFMDPISNYRLKFLQMRKPCRHGLNMWKQR